MKYILAIFFSTSLMASGIAQKQDFTKSADNDPAATKILDKVSKKYEAYKSIEADFSLEIEIPEEPVETQKGLMKTQGKKYYVDLSEMTLICDDESFWMVDKRNKEVQENDAPDEEELEDEGMLSPQEFYNFYKKGKYVYALTNALTEDRKPVLQIEFKPLDDDSEYSKIRMTIEKKTSTVKRVKVFSKDGSRFTLKINKLTPNKKFTKADFVLNKSDYKGYHIENVRM